MHPLVFDSGGCFFWIQRAAVKQKRKSVVSKNVAGPFTPTNSYDIRLVFAKLEGLRCRFSPKERNSGESDLSSVLVASAPKRQLL